MTPKRALTDLVPEGHRIVYRVERADDGIGPFTWSARTDKAGQAELDIALSPVIDNHTHPMPYDDGIRVIAPNLYYGFAALEQLVAWFGPVLSVLDQIGFVVRTYTVPPRYVYDGGTQSAFFRDKATQIDEMRPTDVPDVLNSLKDVLAGT